MSDLLHSINSIGQQQSSSGCGSLCRADFIVEVPEMTAFPIGLDRRGPLRQSLVPRNAAKARRAPALSARVLRVVATRNDAEIAPAIVEPVAVDVICDQPVAMSKPQKLAAQAYLPPSPVGIDCAISACIPARQVPAPLPHDGGVVSVNHRVCHKHPVRSRKRDEERSVTLIQRRGGQQVTCPGACAGRQRSVVRNVESTPARIADQFDAMTKAGREAAPAAESCSAGIDPVLCGKELPAALFTDTKNGTLTGHWEASLPGVAPPDVDASRGYLRCINSTTNATFMVAAFGTLS